MLKNGVILFSQHKVLIEYMDYSLEYRISIILIVMYELIYGIYYRR